MIFFLPYISENRPKMGEPKNCPNGKLAMIRPSKTILFFRVASGMIDWIGSRNIEGKIGRGSEKLTYASKITMA
jgi:hypothetical protein